MFNFTRNRTVSQSGCTILHSHQRYIRVSVALHLHYHFIGSEGEGKVVCLVSVILREVPSYCGLISISLRTNNIVLFSGTYLSPTYPAKLLFKSFVHFLIGLFSYCWLLRVLSIIYIKNLYQMWFTNIFSQSATSFHSHHFFQRAVFNFNEIKFIKWFCAFDYI